MSNDKKDGAEVHIIPQMGADRYWFKQYETGKITREEWLDAFLNKKPVPRSTNS